MTATVARLGHFGMFAGRMAWGALRPPYFADEILRQTARSCVRCFVPVTAVTFSFGMVLALQGLNIFALYGAQRMLSSLVALAVVRELSPLLASVLIAAQGGSACAAELGAMRIREELDATDVMAVDSVKFHASPRLGALTVAAPVLNIFGSFAGILGAWVVAVLVRGENSGVYWSQLWALCTPVDVWGGTLKSTVFGAIIGFISAWNGYHVTGGAAGVGRAVNQTVVQSVVVFIVLNYLLSTLLYGSTL